MNLHLFRSMEVHRAERADRLAPRACPGQPGLPPWLVAGLFILKHMHDLSDEVLCARWSKIHIINISAAN